MKWIILFVQEFLMPIHHYVTLKAVTQLSLSTQLYLDRHARKS